MHLATATLDGRPSGRVILLKGFDQSGFVFFSNYQSRKGRDLTDNPHAAITFMWLELFRQVRIEGIVSKVSEAESEAYFQTRSRNSQLGAWASEQSKALSNRQQLEDRFRDAEKRFDGKPVTRPPYWGGYCLEPTRLEFWQGRAGRIHDRIEYTPRPEGMWKKQRLFP